jgi:hypothetical protein
VVLRSPLTNNHFFEKASVFHIRQFPSTQTNSIQVLWSHGQLGLLFRFLIGFPQAGFATIPSLIVVVIIFIIVIAAGSPASYRSFLGGKSTAV